MIVYAEPRVDVILFLFFSFVWYCIFVARGHSVARGPVHPRPFNCYTVRNSESPNRHFSQSNSYDGTSPSSESLLSSSFGLMSDVVAQALSCLGYLAHQHLLLALLALIGWCSIKVLSVFLCRSLCLVVDLLLLQMIPQIVLSFLVVLMQLPLHLLFFCRII